jgi:hypothetical protein
MSELEKRLIAFVSSLMTAGLPWGEISKLISYAKDLESGRSHVGYKDYDAAQKLVTELLDGVRL